MSRCDAIVIGGGHNGLVAASRLTAKGRRSVLLLERHAVVGGLAIGDEFHPGYTSAGPLHDTSGFDPRDHLFLGLETDDTPAPVFVPQAAADGPGLLLHHDPAHAADEIARLSQADARRYADYHGFIERVRPFLKRLLIGEPPAVDSIWSVFTAGAGLRRLGRTDMLEVLRVGPMCVADWLNEHFETELLSSALAMPALSGTRSGPWSPGSAANLLRYEVLARAGIRGGAAAIVDALDRDARTNGVEIRCDAEVTGIRTTDDRVVGVTLADGSTIDAPTVVATCDPKQVFLELLEPSAVTPKLHHRMTKVRATGAMAIVDLALSGPLRFGCRPDLDAGRIRIVSTLDDMECAFDATKYGRVSTAPVLEVVVPTVESPDLVPPGHHVASIMTHFAPYDLKGGWTASEVDSLGDTVVSTLASFAPNVTDLIVGRRVRTPVDLETRYGVTGGHIHHVEHALDHMIVRPDPQCAIRHTDRGSLPRRQRQPSRRRCDRRPGMLAAKVALRG